MQSIRNIFANSNYFVVNFQISSNDNECDKVFAFKEETSIKSIKTETSHRRMNSRLRKTISLGGLSNQEAKLKSVFEQNRISRLNLTGFLISGPPGSGKTSLVKKSLNENCLLLRVQCSNLMRPHPGETEKVLRDLFKKAKLHSEEGPTLLLLEDIDLIGNAQNGQDSKISHNLRVISQLRSLLD